MTLDFVIVLEKFFAPWPGYLPHIPIFTVPILGLLPLTSFTALPILGSLTSILGIPRLLSVPSLELVYAVS